MPIPGATKLAHWGDNLAAADVVLAADDLRQIDAAFATIDIKGAALSTGLDATIDRTQA